MSFSRRNVKHWHGFYQISPPTHAGIGHVQALYNALPVDAVPAICSPHAADRFAHAYNSDGPVMCCLTILSFYFNRVPALHQEIDIERKRLVSRMAWKKVGTTYCSWIPVLYTVGSCPINGRNCSMMPRLKLLKLAHYRSIDGCFQVHTTLRT
jgi:hypothetical protein